ncbi:MAG: hypothetical protein KAX44_00710 [Candidatus Brocadiae bacterium]|nr:hypothetical protein [Candidatus Brocadiia bacterium]
MDELREVFKDPGSAYRGKPFWAWNGKLEAEELRRQIRVMHRMGLGGFFMHSRVGLATPYLSDEWFEMVEACIDEARKLGMEAWLYDEDRWPSGAAGGLVTKDPRYQHKRLQMVICDPAEAEFSQEPLALFSARIDGHLATDVRRLGVDWDGKVSPADAQVLAFFVAPDEPSSWHNDATYLDTMSHEAVRRFIEVTHEAYKQRVGEHFGSLVPGVFTDEPNCGNIFQRGRFEGRQAVEVPWTPELPRHFKERYGYDILDHLPHIFFVVDGQQVSKARYHYHDCKTFLFVDAFARQVGEWCGRNNLMLTGHVLAEETLRRQTSVVGSAMRFYEHMQAPGIDILMDRKPEYSTAKQCSSVLHQTGRRWLLSELYGCTGWDFPFEGHKAIGDWQAALGINLRCQHLYWYTMAGQAKRDYPASIAHQSPWWAHYGKVEDYFARVGAAMSRGQAVRRLLFIHPVESVWARASIGWREDEKLERLDEQFDLLLLWLLDGHVDFDYADEEMLSRLGAIRSAGPVDKESGPVLSVGQADYTVVLVPPADTLRATTLDRLKEFKEAGGTVVFCEPLPAYVEAESSDRAAEFAQDCNCVAFEPDAILSAVEEARVLSIADESGGEKSNVLYLLHREGDELRLFMCNTDRQNATGPLTVRVLAQGNVQLWDAESGGRYATDSEQADGWVRFCTSMSPAGSRLFVITAEAEDLPPAQQPGEVRSVELAAAEWTSELTDFNVLVLDMPEYKVGGADWSGPLEILRADTEIRTAIGLPTRGGAMVQPWAREKKQGPTGHVALRYRFQVDQVPHGPIFLAVENPRYFEIGLNGNPVPTDGECDWWVDPAIRLLPLDEAALVPGENTLLLSGTMDDDCNLEICYLLGDFAVAVDGDKTRITGALPPVTFGDWTAQGMPFYSGSVVFRTPMNVELADGERLFVEVPEFAGACVRVLVDGQEAGVIGWQPHEVEVTRQVAGKREAELAVEVIAHRHNAFGPLHHVPTRPQWVGPGQFVTSGEYWQDAYSLVPVGCMVSPRLSIRPC